MNNKLVYLFVVLVAGLFVISACEQAVGKKVNDKNNKKSGVGLLKPTELPGVTCACVKDDGSIVECEGFYDPNTGYTHCECCGTALAT